MECYFLAMGLSQGWYVRAQSAASVAYVCADSLIQHQFVFPTGVRFVYVSRAAPVPLQSYLSSESLEERRGFLLLAGVGGRSPGQHSR